MADKIKQYYGIKYPFTDNNHNGHFIDLNQTIEDKVASDILHVILTRKGTRIRRPNFGTDLTKYIFEPSDELTWENVENEVKNAVNTYVPSVKINTIEVVQSEEDERNVYIDINYTVMKGATPENNRLVAKL